MYVYVHAEVIHSAAAFHWLGEDGISVLVVDDEEVITHLTVWSD